MKVRSPYGTQGMLTRRGGVDLGRQIQLAAKQIADLAEFNTRKAEVDSREHKYDLPESVFVLCTQLTNELWVAESIEKVGGVQIRNHGKTPEQAAGAEFRWQLVKRLWDIRAEKTFDDCRRRGCKVNIVIADRRCLKDGQRRYGE